jgi:hypothetical protein
LPAFGLSIPTGFAGSSTVPAAIKARNGYRGTGKQSSRWAGEDFSHA